MTEQTLRRTTVLLVETNEPDAARFETMLEEAAPSSLDLNLVTTLADATLLLMEKVPDCVVIGLRLSDPEGLAVLEELSGRAPTAALIVLTEHGRDELERRAGRGRCARLPVQGEPHR